VCVRRRRIHQCGLLSSGLTQSMCVLDVYSLRIWIRRRSLCANTCHRCQLGYGFTRVKLVYMYSRAVQRRLCRSHQSTFLPIFVIPVPYPSDSEALPPISSHSRSLLVKGSEVRPTDLHIDIVMLCPHLHHCTYLAPLP